MSTTLTAQQIANQCRHLRYIRALGTSPITVRCPVSYLRPGGSRRSGRTPDVTDQIRMHSVSSLVTKLFLAQCITPITMIMTSYAYVHPLTYAIQVCRLLP